MSTETSRLDLELNSDSFVEGGDAAVRTLEAIKASAVKSGDSQSYMQAQMALLAAEMAKLTALMAMQSSATRDIDDAMGSALDSATGLGSAADEAAEAIDQLTDTSGHNADAIIKLTDAHEQLAVTMGATLDQSRALVAESVDGSDAVQEELDAHEQLVEGLGKEAVAYDLVTKKQLAYFELKARQAEEAYTVGLATGTRNPIPGTVVAPEEFAAAEAAFDPLSAALKELHSDMVLIKEDFNSGKLAMEPYAEALGLLRDRTLEAANGKRLLGENARRYADIMRATNFSAVLDQLQRMKDVISELKIRQQAGLITQKDYKTALEDLRQQAVLLGQQAQHLGPKELAALNSVLQQTAVSAEHAVPRMHLMTRALTQMALASANLHGPLMQMVQWAVMFAGHTALVLAAIAAVAALVKVYELMNEKHKQAAERLDKLTESLKRWHEEQQKGGQEKGDIKFIEEQIAELQRLQAERQKMREQSAVTPSRTSDMLMVTPSGNGEAQAEQQRKMNQLLHLESVARMKLVEIQRQQRGEAISGLEAMVRSGQATAQMTTQLNTYRAALVVERDQLLQNITALQNMGRAVPEEAWSKLAKYNGDIRGIDDAFRSLTLKVREFKQATDDLWASLDDPTGTTAFINKLKQLDQQIEEMRRQGVNISPDEVSRRKEALATQFFWQQQQKAWDQQLAAVPEGGAGDEEQLQRLQEVLNGLYEAWGRVNEEQAKAFGITDRIREASQQVAAVIARINALHQDDNNTAEEGAQTDAERLRALKLEALPKTIEMHKTMVQSLRTAISLSQAFKGISANAAMLATSVVNIGETLLNAADAAVQFGTSLAKQLKPGDWITMGASLLSSVAGFLGGGAPDPHDVESDRIRKENNQLLRELNRTFGEMGKAITGVQYALAKKLTDALLAAGPSAYGLRHTVRGQASYAFDRDRLKATLEAQGSSLDELKKLAEAYGVTLDMQNGVDEFTRSLKKLDLAIKETELTKFAETFAGKLQAMNAALVVFNVTDPVDKLKRLIDVATGYGKDTEGNVIETGSQAFRDIFKGLDISLAKDRATAEKLLQDLYTKLDQGTIDATMLGGMTPQEFLDMLTELSRQLFELDEFKKTEGATQGYHVDQTITEVTGNRLGGLLESQLFVARDMRDALWAIRDNTEFLGANVTDRGLGLAPVDTVVTLAAARAPAAAVEAPAPAGPVVQIDNITITVEGNLDPTQAYLLGEKLGEGLLTKLNTQNGTQLRRMKLASGNIEL